MKFSEEYLEVLTDRIIEKHRRSLLPGGGIPMIKTPEEVKTDGIEATLRRNGEPFDVCQYCGDVIPVNNSYRELYNPKTGERITYHPIKKLNWVCNRCFIKIQRGELAHTWN